jgi:hypothetical protein
MARTGCCVPRGSVTAVTGVPVPLDELKSWSVERQEAYASLEAVLKRLHPERAR